MKANVHIWSYLAVVFLEWEIFQTKFVEKIRIHIFVQFFFFKKIVPFMR
jgi:hypothetical protein